MDTFGQTNSHTCKTSRLSRRTRVSKDKVVLKAHPMPAYSLPIFTL